MPTHRLLLIRHAQAADAPVDGDRPLTANGTRAATAVGTWLGQVGYAPDRVLVSPALRAQQTWAAAAEALGAAPEATVDQRIYDNTVEAVLEAIREVPDDVRTLVVVGHNPSMGELAFSLDDGSGDDAPRSELHAGFPTGAVAVYRTEMFFADVGPGAATLEDLAVPGR